jgi:hypothetical protein
LNKKIPGCFDRGKGIAMTKLLVGRRPRVKLSKDERMRRLRLGDLRRLVGDRCRGAILPDDDAGREYLKELLLPISLGPNEAVKRARAIEVWGPANRMRREIELWAPWMTDDEAQTLIDEINLMPPWQRKPKARTLGERLQVPYGERARLGLRTIGPCDMTEAGMAVIRKQKKRQRDRLRRLSQGIKPRAEYLATANLSQTKPWLALGISRRTYYYRIENGRCTSPRQVNLLKAEIALVQEKLLDSKASECGRVSTPTPAGQTETCANWGSHANKSPHTE